jgi:ABC-type transport system involved in multi-copper enzyme maturation permease subunit
MKPVFVIARMTWTELLRDRFVALIGFVAVLLLVLSNFLGSLTLDEQKRLLVHLGFAGFQMTLVGLSLFLGSWSLQKELDRQTCLLVLSRPVSRTQFVFGKWLGSLALIAFFWLLSGLLHLGLLGFAIPFGPYWTAHATIFWESGFILCLAFFFASFLRPLLAFASSATLWLAGHWREDLVFFAKKSGSPALRALASVSDWIFPPLNRLEVRTLQFVEAGDLSLLTWPVIHLLFWSTLLLFFAQLIWRRRDLV